MWIWIGCGKSHFFRFRFGWISNPVIYPIQNSKKLDFLILNPAHYRAQDNG
jgi:hypothetical protein